MRVLVTGGAGYIGSHAALALLRAGHEVTVFDDLSRGNLAVKQRLSGLGDLAWITAELSDTSKLVETLTERRIEAVLHFAAVAYVGESVYEPLRYYRRNTAGSLSLLEAMARTNVRRLVFSSTCATYGVPSVEQIPILETCPQEPINPYGRSKLMVEHMIRDHAFAVAAQQPFSFALLRYFNVAGSDREGLIGEVHHPETHLIPLCLEVAHGMRDEIRVFGTDYETKDGSCIRDYVHVEDLVDAHLVVLERLQSGEAGQQLSYNIGTGTGHSVLEVIDACRRVTGREVALALDPRREGDPPVLFADPSKISQELGWTASTPGLDEIVESAWRWLSNHPKGYSE